LGTSNSYLEIVEAIPLENIVARVTVQNGSFHQRYGYLLGTVVKHLLMGDLRYGMLGQPSYVSEVFTDWTSLHLPGAFSLSVEASERCGYWNYPGEHVCITGVGHMP
jgi:hypothetical protein